MKLYVLRHGTTDWNEAKRLQGNSDTELNEKGRLLAKQTAKALEDVPFSHIYSSPLSRAVETAEIVRGHRNVQIVSDRRLIEVCFGIDEGVTVEKRTPGCRLFFDDPDNYIPGEGAESIESLVARTGEFIKEVLVPLSVKEPDATVLISGHGAMNKGLMANFLKREKKNFWDGAWQKNCSISIYEIQGEEFTLLEDGLNYSDA
ncbi:MAG: histidine phosphatase family protein [Lachnospiraceae bacterium]|nr:histidine phosphatase family protein [Lachnospiraceae bacterium]